MKRTNQTPSSQERDELERQVESLRREVRQLRLEQDLLNKANELLKKGLGVDLQLLSNREKTLLIDALKEHYGLRELLAQLGIARSSYFYHRARAVVGDKYLQVRQSITEIFESNHRCYGYRRLQASLTRQQVNISEKVVQRLMKQERLVVPMHKKRRYASYLGEISLGKLGYDLHLIARRGDRLEQIAESLGATYDIKVKTTMADLTVPGELQSVAALLAGDTSLTMLVNNVVASAWGPIAESNTAKTTAIIALNITALTELTIAALSGFRHRSFGTIVNLGSIAAFGIYPGVGIYSGTKAYVLNFTRTLQAELKETDIVVQLVTPGPTVSEARELAGGAATDPAMVMSTEACVDAALLGLAKEEEITAPSVDDDRLVAAFATAGQALFVSALVGKPATRYAKAELI